MKSEFLQPVASISEASISEFINKSHIFFNNAVKWNIQFFNLKNVSFVTYFLNVLLFYSPTQIYRIILMIINKLSVTSTIRQQNKNFFSTLITKIND